MAKDYSKSKRMTGENANPDPKTQTFQTGTRLSKQEDFDLLDTPFGKNVQMEIETADEACERQ